MSESLILYHGTSHARADTIEATGFNFIKRQHRALSFGDGVYFYRDLDKAREFAEGDHESNACVLEVEVNVPGNRLRVFNGSEILNDPSFFNQTAARENALVLDLTRDNGIYVVRPEGLSLISVRQRHI
ncbi:hypothetical protein [Paraburkholderia tagetis]|uniref:PARP catalytic domain-containing protein n=1 Tax=Paraburkholderia tagetis TaxID=2913261 RepID=A0A9X1RV33_9BURK|nr:hypothetical protein [Paraburkholderia tagetis]MCG5076632.1 hypothetical protein [Paraburkholderia tagetis]